MKNEPKLPAPTITCFPHTNRNHKHVKGYQSLSSNKKNNLSQIKNQIIFNLCGIKNNIKWILFFNAFYVLYPRLGCQKLNLRVTIQVVTFKRDEFVQPVISYAGRIDHSSEVLFYFFCLYLCNWCCIGTYDRMLPGAKRFHFGWRMGHVTKMRLHRSLLVNGLPILGAFPFLIKFRCRTASLIRSTSFW